MESRLGAAMSGESNKCLMAEFKFIECLSDLR